MHMLGQLNTLHFCATALAACLATAYTLIMHKTLKMTVHTHTSAPIKPLIIPSASLELVSFFSSYFQQLPPCHLILS